MKEEVEQTQPKDSVLKVFSGSQNEMEKRQDDVCVDHEMKIPLHVSM